MKILVTGGVGFVGHALVAKLEKQGHNVCVVDNFTNYGIIPDRELVPLHQERLACMQTKSIHNVDIRHFTYLYNTFDECRPDMVIHCAAYPRAKAVDADPQTGTEVLTTGLINLLSCCERFSVRRFVYISSSMVYGDFDMYAYEDMACRPRGTYAILKYAGEKLTRDWCNRVGIDHVVLRPSAVYGPLDVNDRVVSRFFQSAMHDQTLEVRGAEELMDFTYVKDTVKGISKAALSFNSSGRVYNITRGNTRTLLEAAELVVKIVGAGKIRIVDADQNFPRRGSFSNIRAGQDFGHRGEINIETGFQLYYDWLNTR
jgi:nucleoside-diphosphate-sugar epimerase